MASRRLILALFAVTALSACGAAPVSGPTTAVVASITDDEVTLDHTAVPAGLVSFGISNVGMDVHEFEIFSGSADDLVVSHDVADTSDLEQIDEIEDIVPGMFMTLDVELEPGVYVVLSNYPGEFARGLYTEVTVTG